MAAVHNNGRGGGNLIPAREKPTGLKKGGREQAAVAKGKLLHILRTERGVTIKDALRRVGYSYKSYEYWRKTDEGFKQDVDLALGRRNREGGGGRKPVPDFPEFCERYLGMRLFWHQLQWFDVLEGRQPRDKHPSQTFTPGADPHLLLVNTPPGHAKSTTITAAYTLWRLLKDPNTQVVIVSKNESMAKKWMFQIQDWLTSRSFIDLQVDFGPQGGFKDSSPVWNKTQIYFGDELRDRNAKDPTLEVLGMGGTIYGARADLIILDDCIDTDNAHDFENQIEWLTGMVLTRPADEDKVLIIGTRVAVQDLYKELLNPQYYEDSESPWTYFAQPAVLEFADDPKDWLTLWPRSNIAKKNQAVLPDDDGLYPKWDGPSLARMRKRISTDPRAWPLKYQQEDVSDDAIFPREAVYGCVNGLRKVGRLDQGMGFQGAGSMRGHYILAGLDPASEGHTAAVAYAVNLDTKRRFVLNVWNQRGATPQQVRELMTRWTQEYGIQEWRIEKVLLSSWITQDRDITRAMANLGCVLGEHQTTGKTKWDKDAGVMSLSGLLQGWDSGSNLVEFPNTNHEGVRALLEQACAFFPGTKGKTDCLMAWWFAEVRARELVGGVDDSTHVESWWDTEVQQLAQVSVSVGDLDEFDETYDPWWG